MSRMMERSQAAQRLTVWVETSVGSGAFELDERLRVDEVRLGSDTTLSTARVSVRLDDGFDAEDCRRRYRADLRILIGTEAAEPRLREMLFEGYPPVHEARWEGLRGRGAESFTFVAEGVYERLSRARASQVFGRYVRTGEIEDGLAGDPSAWEDKAALVAALPCVFNSDGVANCSKTPLTVATPTVTSTGQTRSVYVFTYDDAPYEDVWTYGRVLRYLVWFYTLREGPVFAGNVWEATESTIALQPQDMDRFERGQVLERALLRGVDSLHCEATNLVEALGLWSGSAGLRVTAETIGDGAGGARTQLRVWSAEAGPVCRLSLARGGYDENGVERYPVANRSAREVLEDNNMHAGVIEWSEREVVNAPIVIGDVKRYEMTVELRPSWLPVVGLDNVLPADRAASKAQALVPEDVEALGSAAESNPWFQLYHRRGIYYRFAAHISRRWALNEQGKYSNPLYNRNSPFDDYSPFDFSTVADATVTRQGAWMRRPRPMGKSLTRTAEGGAQKVWVEISFDSGATWVQQSSGVRILTDECGLMFEAENPTEITPPGTDPRDQNLWYAIIDGTFRVRMTGTIESDERLMAERAASGVKAGTLAVNTAVLYRPGEFRFASRSGTTNALLDVNPTKSHDDRDDTEAASLLADEVARQHQERRVRGLPAIPWVDTEFAIGDRIAGVRGREVRLATTADLEGRYPAVIGKRYVFRDGRYETRLELERTSVRV